MEQKQAQIKQIIVITDGKSNVGNCPIEAAKRAYEKGIVVSSIGIINNNEKDNESDIGEIEGIANAGGGVFQYTHIDNLSQTMHVVTQKTTQKTLEQIVSKQLKSIVGAEITELSPKYRYKIIDFIEKYGDAVNLKCVLALDISGSMKNKIETAKKSVIDLIENIKSRKGFSEIAVIVYPGIKDCLYEIICNFEDSSDRIKENLKNISAQGKTPTGPAIEEAASMILDEDLEFIAKRYYV